MKPLIIFGAGDIGQLAHYYWNLDGGRKVAAFTVDAAYVTDQNFCGLPVLAFEEVRAAFPPTSHDLFVALSYARLNNLRKEKFLAAKALGYALPSYVSSRATVLSQYAVGENCFVLEDNTIQPFARIADNVTLWSGNHIGHHSVIGSHTFISSHVVVSGGVTIGENCFLGVNATLRDHVSIGDRCVIGAGALILESAEPGGVFLGKDSERSRVPSGRLRRI